MTDIPQMKSGTLDPKMWAMMCRIELQRASILEGRLTPVERVSLDALMAEELLKGWFAKAITQAYEEGVTAAHELRVAESQALAGDMTVEPLRTVLKGSGEGAEPNGTNTNSPSPRVFIIGGPGSTGPRANGGDNSVPWKVPTVTMEIVPVYVKGSEPRDACPECNGRGKVTRRYCAGHGDYRTETFQCAKCDGTGEAPAQEEQTEPDRDYTAEAWAGCEDEE